MLVGSFDGDVLQPLVMGKAVSLHPLAIVFAIAAGGIALGIVGALIAVPVAGAIYSVTKYLTGRDPEHPYPAVPPAPSQLTGGAWPGADAQNRPRASTHRGSSAGFHRLASRGGARPPGATGGWRATERQRWAPAMHDSALPSAPGRAFPRHPLRRLQD